MVLRTCRIPWCGKQAKPKGTLCSAHYEEQRIHGRIRTPEEKQFYIRSLGVLRKEEWRGRRGWGRTCKVEECDREPIIRGYCPKHYSRWRIHGDPHVNKRAGRIVAASGYVLVKKHGHPRADVRGYVREHILVAEAMLGRSLHPDEVVHHINGDPRDNRPENLVVMLKGAHTTLHMNSRWRGRRSRPDGARFHPNHELRREEVAV